MNWSHCSLALSHWFISKHYQCHYFTFTYILHMDGLTLMPYWSYHSLALSHQYLVIYIYPWTPLFLLWCSFSMVDTFMDQFGFLDFQRSQHGSGMSSRSQVRQMSWYIEAGRKWLIFCRWHIQIICFLLYPPYRRIGGCYGFTSKPPATRRPQPAMVLTR